MAKSGENRSKLDMLKAKREMFYSRIHRIYSLSKNVVTYDSRSNENFLSESETIDEIRLRFECIVDEINLLTLQENPEATPDYKSLEAFEDLYVRVKRVRNNIQGASKMHGASPSPQVKSAVNLPPIDIPTFDGKRESWPLFYESFKANIHLNPSLNDSQRVQYLIGKLTSNALTVTAGIVPTGETYSIIWNGLVKKYQDKRALGTHYLNNILDLKVCNNSATSMNAFIDKYSASLAALKQLDISDLTDFILLHCGLKKVDAQVAHNFENSVRDVEIPTCEAFISFVQDQVKILERSSSQSNVQRVSNAPTPSGRSAGVSHAPGGSSRTHTYKSFVANNDAAAATSLATMTGTSTAHASALQANRCVLCNNADHTHLFACMQFKNIFSPQGRYDYIKIRNGCVNCLSLTHTGTTCNSRNVCSLCQKRHHTLLHFEKTINTNTHIQTSEINTYNCGDEESAPLIDLSPCETLPPPSLSSYIQAVPENFPSMQELNILNIHSEENVEANVDPLLNSEHNVAANDDAESFTFSQVKPGSTILLSTAQVYAKPKNCDQKVTIRCLIDSGSQNNLITTDCCKLLNLPVIPLANAHLKGVGTTSRPVHGYVYIDIESRVYPSKKYHIHALVVDHITDQLPSQLIENSHMTYLKDIPLADLTWNIPGNVDVILGAQIFPEIYLGDKIETGSSTPPAISTTLGYVLMGDIPVRAAVQQEFSITAFSLNDLNESLHKFWETEEIPNKKFLSSKETECENIYAATVTRNDEGRFSVDLPFMEDPSNLGDSRAIAHRRYLSLERKLKNDSALRAKYNNVIKEYMDNGYLSETTDDELLDEGYYIPHHAVEREDKPTLRIVLDASSKTHTGLSLNDVLHTGPNLQANLFLLLLDFRLLPIALTADIKAMYMQIEIPKYHRKYCRILYRFNDHEPIRTFHFNRVPFGLKSSPFLAMRTVRELAEMSREKYPLAAMVAQSQLYMDDLVCSVENNSTALKLSEELIDMFKSGGFDLVKWTSNSVEVLQALPESHRALIQFEDDDNKRVKVLGLSWESSSDNFRITTSTVDEKCTKRTVLSLVARLFDVLGLVAPVILYAKLIIKDLWLSGIGWDDNPPETIIRRFAALRQELPLLETLQIPRHIGVFENSTVNIVAFCDASLNGYGSVVYLHVTHPSGCTSVRLLCSKSKVSSPKVVTLARLELCAALIMSKLVKVVKDDYSSRISIKGVYAFTDSMIALSWIKSPPHRWSIYVSNRIAQCQENLSPEDFYHVAGNQNPSDCLSRGLLPSQIVTHDLWWNGPAWMRSPISTWPIKQFKPMEPVEMPELKSNTLLITETTVEQPRLLTLLQRVSSWNKLLRIVVLVIKFVKWKVPSFPLTPNIESAENTLVKFVQRVHFADELDRLSRNELPSKRFRSLDIFLDQNKVLRIGGRLTNSDLPFHAKHPILLPKKDQIVNLIIDHYHVINCHTGPGLLMSLIRQRYWILDARTVIRAKVRQCNKCFRVKPLHTSPKMADLPACRVQEAKAFLHAGVDYAGPLRVSLSRRRGQRTQKAYICLFVCLVTRALHIELASELTSDAFLAAFKRFISRRGPVAFLYSDNGKNFVGAKSELDEMYALLCSKDFRESLDRELFNRRITWKMIPPRAPHFGGIWESNIKSLKTHLYRVIGNQILSYEELLTVLVQIEAILNSRPLCLLSSDPHLEVLTPAHFLMSTPLQYLPASDLSDQRFNLVNRKRLLDSLVQSYWKKWRTEYLHTLQVRQKWNTPDHPVQVGTVVLVGQDDAPPLSWPLGVITEIYPGADSVIRVASVKTKDGSYKRPIVKLYPLPSQ